MATTLDLDFTTGALDPRITFSRAGLGTHFDSAGLLRYGAHNLILQSQNFDASWSKQSSATVTVDATTAPDGTTTADRLNHTVAGTVTGGGVSHGYALVNAAICSVYAKAGTKNWLILAQSVSTGGTLHCYFNLATGVVGLRGSSWTSSGIESVGNGWYRCWGLLTLPTNTLIVLRVGETDSSTSCTSPGDISIWGAQVENVTTATTPSTYTPTTSAAVHSPRFDHDPVTHAAKGLLIEEVRTNQVSNSDDFAHANWVKTGVTATSNQITSPDGTTTADLITASASPATITSAAIGVGTGIIYVHSAFAKKGTSDWIYMVGQTVDAPNVWFNLNTGVVGTVQAGITSAAIENVGDGWYRCQFADIGQTGVESVKIGVCDADNSTTVTIGRTAYLWGAQCESGPGVTLASSYIPTGAGVNVARAADIAVMTGSNFSDWYNQSAGTFVAEFVLLAASGTRGIISADNNTTAEQILLYSSGTDPKAKVRDGSVDQADLDVGTVAASTTYKLGVSYALNDIAASLNGGAVGTDVTATMPTPTQLRIGCDTTNYLNGHILHLQFQNTALTDAELITLTTPGPWSGGEPVPPAVGPTTTGGAAFWDQEYDGREYESSRKRRKRFLEERERRVAELE